MHASDSTSMKEKRNILILPSWFFNIFNIMITCTQIEIGFLGQNSFQANGLMSSKLFVVMMNYKTKKKLIFHCQWAIESIIISTSNFDKVSAYLIWTLLYYHCPQNNNKTCNIEEFTVSNIWTWTNSLEGGCPRNFGNLTWKQNISYASIGRKRELNKEFDQILPSDRKFEHFPGQTRAVGYETNL